MAASDQGKTVFLCHAGESKPFVRQLVDRLKTDGLKEDQIFFDERSLEPGDELDSIVKVIESPSLKLFVFVVSKYCFDNDRTWIRTEWEAALVNNIQILPIWLDDNNDDFKAFANLVRKFSYKLRKMIAQRVNPQEISTALPSLSEKIFSLVSGDQPTQRRSPPTTDVVLSSVRPNFMPDVLPAKLKLEFVQKVYNQILEKAEGLFDDATLKDEERLKEADKIFNRFKARIESIIPKGCFIFNLRFFQPCNVDEFYHDHFRLGPASLSAALTRLLITDEMRAAAGGEELMVRVEVRYDDYIRVRRQLSTAGLPKATSLDNLSTLVRPRTVKSLRHFGLEALDLVTPSAQDTSFTVWIAHPGTRDLANSVKRNSKHAQVVDLSRRLEIQDNIVRSLHREVTHLKEKDEKAQKIFMSKTEEINRLQVNNKRLEATIEALMVAKPKVVIPSSGEVYALRAERGEPKKQGTLLLRAEGGAPAEKHSTEKGFDKYKEPGILRATSVDNLSTLVRPRSLSCPSLEGLDMAATSARDSSVTEWLAYPYTRHLADSVKRKSQQVTALERRLEMAKHHAEIQENVVKSLHKEVTRLDKKDEEAQKILMTNTEQIQQLQGSNKA